MDSLRDQLGRPLRDLRISVTDRCNLRCGYCMPAHIFGPDYAFLPPDRVLSFEEIARVAGHFAAAGAVKVRLTGGEPLLRPNLSDLVHLLREKDGIDEIVLTTNGWFLARQAASLKAAGLDRINVSLDALSDSVAGRMNGRGLGVARVLEGIAAAVAAGLPLKVNMVVQRGMNDGEILPMARYFRKRAIPLRFIEFMDVGNHNAWSREKVVPSAEIRKTIAAEWPLETVEAAYRGEVARRYRYVGSDVEVGFISSVTASFCQDCGRARLSADGKLYTCLFASEGTDLAGPLRRGASDEELAEILRRVWGGRADRYSEERAASSGGCAKEKVEMSFVGG